MAVRLKAQGQRLILILDTLDLDKLRDYLEANAERIKEFLELDSKYKLILDLGDLVFDEEGIKELIKILTNYRLKVSGILSDNPVTKIIAADYGLPILSSLISTSHKLPESVRRTDPVSTDGPNSDSLNSDSLRGRVQPVTTLGEERKSLTIRRNVRSGTSIEFDGNVILLGNLNPGAEIRATGNIIVIGQLKGTAHAGFRGDHNSFIFASQLRAPQVRIGSKVGTLSPGEHLDNCLIYLREDKIVIEEQ